MLPPRLFWLQRDEDATGISGTGRVAWGTEYPDGTVTLRWCTGRCSTGVYASIHDVELIHGHHGWTQIRWVEYRMLED